MVIGATLCWLSGQNMPSQALAGPGAAAAASVLAGQRFGPEWTGINSRCLQRMETEIAQLVSEAFVCKQPRDIQQEQLMRENAAAVREAILVHARPILNPDPFLGSSESLSASNWKRLLPILAVLMPVFWFGVIKGLWGSLKVRLLHSGTVLVHGQAVALI